jgi:8-oxo-dGTP diphosphatase
LANFKIVNFKTSTLPFELCPLNYTYEYPRPAVSADIAVFRKAGQSLEILLIQRKNEPYRGMWALPGGFMEIEESLEETAARELEEETGLKNVDLKQFKAFSQVDRDPRTRVVTVVFYGTVTVENSAVKGGDDAEKADWFEINNLPSLGFDHSQIIRQLSEQFQE